MLDFLKVSKRLVKKDIEIYPKFIVGSSEDLMIRGGDFYAIWNEKEKLWSTDENVALALIDAELNEYYEKNKTAFDGQRVNIMYMWDSDSKSIDKWHKYCQKQMRDYYKPLDESIIFSNKETTKFDYASKKLTYPLEPCKIDAYEELISTLYSKEERKKLEWAIGAIVTGASKEIQKFVVMYGSAGTGKSTILNIIQDLFEGYYSVFDAKALGSNNNSFALEAFKSNPLVAIQHDGDLSRIEDNTRLNSVVSHELMTVNEKFKSAYTNKFNAFLFMGTNKPVKITDAKSGILRRLIDVSPSGNKLPPSKYKKLMNQIKFELGGIAYHCKEVYLKEPGAYDNYVPTSMMGASNDFYNFVLDCYDSFTETEGVTLKSAWEKYKNYCDDAKVPYPFTQRVFKEELKNYFKDFYERYTLEDGSRVRNYYISFTFEKFKTIKAENQKPKQSLELKEQESAFDILCADCHAQYTTNKETPIKKWESVTETLKELDTSKLHYVKVPENHIVIDFDLKNENKEKDFGLNLEAASKWPETYAEVSKGGAGIHLHYIYTGDPTKLSNVYDDNIEIKVFTGGSSLRRKLTKCNDKPIATISSGLPLKGGTKRVINTERIKSEKSLRELIIRNLNKEIHPGTKPSIDFIYKILEDAYNDGLKYDISDMRSTIFAFAASSTHQSDYCMKLVQDMKFKSDDISDTVPYENKPIVFYDVEVFPNLFLINWKAAGPDKKVVRMINPRPDEVEELIKNKLVGFNCRRYDNHMLYARLMGYTNKQLYLLSQRIVQGDRNAFFGEAYNISYTDVYDFCSKKQSLKKWEIELYKEWNKVHKELQIKHHELGLPWDQEVDESLWEKVAEYCDDDVLATEATFEARKEDFTAREILANITDATVNDTTNSLTTKLIFGNNRKPQGSFRYRDLSKPVKSLPNDILAFLKKKFPKMMEQTFGPDKSLLPYHPGYEFKMGKSIYKGVEVGEGGRVWAKPGMYGRTKTYDVASMHPHSAMRECVFGPEYTLIFSDIVDARVAIKHGDWDTAKSIFGGKLSPYIDKIIAGELSAKALAGALKIAINSVYGLTDAKFENPFRDPNNIDNIVAKAGALFMMDLQEEVEKRGGQVIHIKTDSIKVVDPSPEIEEFILDYGERHGYFFEVEHVFEKICLVNDAVYVAKLAEDDPEDPGQWTATGTQFQVPYVFKTCFTREPIEFSDMCETKSVTSSLYLDINENLPDVSNEEKELTQLEKKYKTGKISDTIYEPERDRLVEAIAKGHNYIFVGKVGQFTPVNDGYNGGVLVREKDGKYYAVTGTKNNSGIPYRWKESDIVEQLNMDINKVVNKQYYIDLVDDAIETISKFGDYEWFIS